MMRRKVISSRNSILGSGTWEELDWNNWWMDAWETEAWRYLHVSTKDKQSVHRIYPRDRLGMRVTLGMHDGALYWIYDQVKEI